MNRRDFLLSAAAAAALVPRLKAAQSAKAGPIPAIDTHTHFYDPTRPEGVPWPPKNDALLYRPRFPADWRALAAPHQVIGTVVVEASEWVEDNAWILELAKSNPDIVGFIGNLLPGQPEFAGNLRRFAANPLFRGLRLRGKISEKLDDAAVLADLKRVADSDLSIDLIGGPAIAAVTQKLAGRLPTLRIVINHLPFKEWDGNPSAMREALTVAASQPNVYIKVSAVVRRVNGKVVTDPAFYRPGLDVLFELFGPDRVVYASNWPVSDHISPYANVYGVVADYFTTKSRAVAEKFFWRNSHALYRWLPRGAAAGLLR